MYPLILVLEKKRSQVQTLQEYILATLSLIIPSIRITKHTRGIISSLNTDIGFTLFALSLIIDFFSTEALIVIFLFSINVLYSNRETLLLFSGGSLRTLTFCLTQISFDKISKFCNIDIACDFMTGLLVYWFPR